MNAIEIRNLSKSFCGMYAVDHLNMTVPVGAIYGFIGENGSGKADLRSSRPGQRKHQAVRQRLYRRRSPDQSGCLN
ncbi:MAG: hypothetical protein ACI4TG_06965 [Ruminococcus sp.]